MQKIRDYTFSFTWKEINGFVKNAQQADADKKKNTVEKPMHSTICVHRSIGETRVVYQL